MLKKIFYFAFASSLIFSSTKGHELHMVVEHQASSFSNDTSSYELVRTTPVEPRPQSTKITKRELVMAGVGLTLLTIYAVYELRSCFGEDTFSYGGHCQMPSLNATLDEAFATCCTEYKGADGNLTSQAASWCREIIDNCTCESQDGHGRGTGFPLLSIAFQGCNIKELVSKINSQISTRNYTFTYFDFYRTIDSYYDFGSHTITTPSVNFFNDTIYQVLTRFCEEGLKYISQPISSHLTGTYFMLNRTNQPGYIDAWPLCLESQCVASHVEPAPNSLCPNGSWSVPLAFAIVIYAWFSYSLVCLFSC